MTPLEQIIKQLDKWIEDSDKQADIFNKRKMTTSEMGSRGKAQAYWDIK